MALVSRVFMAARCVASWITGGHRKKQPMRNRPLRSAVPHDGHDLLAAPSRGHTDAAGKAMIVWQGDKHRFVPVPGWSCVFYCLCLRLIIPFIVSWTGAVLYGVGSACNPGNSPFLC
jgi:hypothetical protein